MTFKCTVISAVLLYCTMICPVLNPADACTGITLKSDDGAVVYGRTLEWGAFDLKSRAVVIPRNVSFTGKTPDRRPGYQWKSRYGAVGIDVLEKMIVADGMNEKGLAVGLFYHPGYASYQAYMKNRDTKTICPTDVPQYILTQFATVDEVREGMKEIRVVPVVEPALGFSVPAHYIVTDLSGKAIVIEYLNGQCVIVDNPIGVLTNAPDFRWHMTNLRNYINLSPVALPGKKIGNINFKPLGAGSGMIGLPGDFTPPSRFVRAVAFSKTARPTQSGEEATYEVFRILDNFNVPVGAVEGTGDSAVSEMRSATVWTSVSDTRSRCFYYHTQHNRRVRKIDLKAIDFAALGRNIRYQALDKEKKQDLEDITTGF